MTKDDNNMIQNISDDFYLLLWLIHIKYVMSSVIEILINRKFIQIKVVVTQFICADIL